MKIDLLTPHDHIIPELIKEIERIDRLAARNPDMASLIESAKIPLQQAILVAAFEPQKGSA